MAAGSSGSNSREIALSNIFCVMVLENRPPVWNAAPVVSAPFGASLIVNLLGYASDPENDVITFTSIGTPLPAGWSIVGTELRYSGGGAIATTNNIRLRATASGGSADSALFSITVYSLPPSWSAAPAPPSVVIGTASSYSLLPPRLGPRERSDHLHQHRDCIADRLVYQQHHQGARLQRRRHRG
jgi:hypothetical protein